MVCERARVTIDEAPSSPVTHRVRLSCHVASYATPYPSFQCVFCCYSRLALPPQSPSYICLFSPVRRRVWLCSTRPLKCFTTQTAGGTLTPSTSVRAAQSSRLLRETCWESSSCRWGVHHRKWASASVNILRVKSSFKTNTNIAQILCNVGKFCSLIVDWWGWQACFFQRAWCLLLMI